MSCIKLVCKLISAETKLNLRNVQAHRMTCLTSALSVGISGTIAFKYLGTMSYSAHWTQLWIKQKSQHDHRVPNIEIEI
jgi:hypothetical protein